MLEIRLLNIYKLTRQAHRAHVTNFYEISVTEARGSVVHMNRRGQDKL